MHYHLRSMKERILRYSLLLALLLGTLTASASQHFFNLTAQEVEVDSVLPRFLYSIPLGDNYEDSVYTVTVRYPEYIDMTVTDVANYNKLSGAALPSQVAVEQHITVSRQKGYLLVSFCPLVFRSNKYQALASFMLDIKARALRGSALRAKRASVALASSVDKYAAHSVLASGKWAKIRVGESGIYQLTESVIRQAGFTDLDKVKIYGYGGNLQNEALKGEDLAAYDDLKEVPQCIVGGRHLFYGKGPVSWASSTITTRTRNPYSDYGYYFITQGDDAPATVDSTEFVNSFYLSSDGKSVAPDFYHSLYEEDGYSWYHGGRNLFSPTAISVGGSQQLVIENPTSSTKGTLYVNVSSGTNNTVAQVMRKGKQILSVTIKIGSYCTAAQQYGTVAITDMEPWGRDTITIAAASGGDIRLDYVSMTWNAPMPAPSLTASFPTATYVYNIENQDLHAADFADLVIIIPTSQKLRAQAERLKAHHESHDGMRVNIVPADELYNEFASGTPDANAYRRYLRMLYDKAGRNTADMPKYLLLFGDCVWDNRMLTSACRNLSADDYLLAFESENSFSETACYVSDSWYGILAEGAGSAPTREMQDVGVGRFPVTTAAEAKIMVDKTINYATDASGGGAWQNTLMFMGDDGNNNVHMTDVNSVADSIASYYPGFLVKKVMWDAYTRQSSSTGFSYPDVTKAIKQQQSTGALVMDYAGHGSATQISHEQVLLLSDFAGFRNKHLPLWVTAACDIMPFDGVDETIGETAVLNENGGAVAFYGTTRTVFTTANKYINHAFMKRVLSLKDDGTPITIGEAHRLAQNDVMLGNNYYYSSNGDKVYERDVAENHLQYSLLGDPALSLNLPTQKVVVDSIDGVAVGTDQLPQVEAGSVVKVVGHVENGSDFTGYVAATVRDSRELVTCKLNNTSSEGAETAFTYYDRQNTLYNGSDSVCGGKFEFTFAVPKDINYSDKQGLINLYAYSSTGKRAHGACDNFIVGGSEDTANDSIGPSIYCYLNSPTFVDGGNVNTTPYFVAQLKDKDGINASGSGIGHDLLLTIDGDMNKTYSLNDYFAYDFGTYTSGSAYYSIPELEEGKHTLQFRAWDIQNNSSTVSLNFNVVKGLEPQLFDVNATNNPARTSTTFIISHDRTECNMDVVLEIFDASGREIWRYSENGLSGAGTYEITWDLTVDGGRPLQTGVYIYRIKVASEGSSYASKAKKLIVINNK